jgi:hypothetical protein
MMNAIMLSVIMHIIVMLNAVTMSVVAPTISTLVYYLQVMQKPTLVEILARRGQKWVVVTNALAYHTGTIITIVKSFLVLVPTGANVINTLTEVIY